MQRGLIDFVKIKFDGIDIDRLLKHEKLDFKQEVSKSSGELSEDLYIAEYRTCKIKVITSKRVVGQSCQQHVEFTGSLHKLSNSLNDVFAPNRGTGKADKGFNGNEFTIDDLYKVIHHLQVLFSCMPTQMVLQNIEIGVNVPTSFDPKEFLDGLLYHNNKAFDFLHEGNSAQVRHVRYFQKIYNKSFQYGMAYHVLRVELKYVKMHDLKAIGIRTLGDLNEQTLNKAQELLVQKFEEVMAYDDTIRKSELNKVQQAKLKDFERPKYWLKELKPNRRDKQKKLLRDIIAKHSDNRQRQIVEIIAGKGVIFNRVGQDSESVINNTSIIGLTNTQNRGLQTCSKTRRFCIITGVDISMQKGEGIMLTYVGAKYYFLNEPEVFVRLKQGYLTSYWDNADTETQLKELAHNIRTIKKNQVLKNKRRYPASQQRLFDIDA